MGERIFDQFLYSYFFIFITLDVDIVDYRTKDVE